MKKYSMFCLAACLFMSSQVYATSGGAEEGQVIDETTQKPIADAIVTVTWGADIMRIRGVNTWCYHAENTRTDADGRFRIPAWSRETREKELVMFNRHVGYYVTKTGYIKSDLNGKPPIILMKPFQVPAEEYFFKLSGMLPKCGESPKLYPAWAEVLKEAREKAENHEQRSEVRDIERIVEELQELAEKEGLK